MAGRAIRRASSSVSATKMLRITPIAAPPGNSALGEAAPPRLAKASRKASMFFPAKAVGPSVTKCSPRSPAQVDPIALDEPYQNAGCGRCSGRSAIGTFA